MGKKFMNKLKNLIANSPIYVGFAFQKVSQAFYGLSIRLHITLKTDIGLKVIQAKEAMEKMAKAMKEMEQMQRTQYEAQQKEAQKLQDILKPEVQQLPTEETPTGVIRLVKKNSESKN